MSKLKSQLNRFFSLFLMLSLTASMLGAVATPDLRAQAASDPAPARQDQVTWFDNDWDYRRVVSVASPCGVDAAGYQVQINLDASFDFSRALPDGSDLRFTAGDGVTLIPHWIESWDPGGGSASIWVKLPALPAAGTSVYLYYGNPTPPAETIIETPPTGPWTRAAGNPIVPIGVPAGVSSLLAENIVYDAVSGHYWMVHANYNDGGVGLVWSDTPTDPASWHWHGTVVPAANAPHILSYAGKWYIVFSDWSTPSTTTRHSIQIVEATSIGGPYTNRTTILSPEPNTWENWRVDEPYLFQRGDGKWILVYMGDQGDFENGQFYYEQVGYASADNLMGPYTKFAGNPFLAWGPPGSFDAGTIADAWVVEFHGTYYIGYTVSSTIYSPWQTAVATTADWETFTKLGVIFPLGPSGAWDAVNAFRGAVTRIDDTYVFAYTGDSYRMGIATQPVFMQQPFNEPGVVFPFYDDFNDGAFNTSKWLIDSGTAGQYVESGGLLTLNSNGTALGQFAKIVGQSGFGMNTLVEVFARHPQAGVDQMIVETGWMGAGFTGDKVRIADDFHNITHWERQAALSSTAGDPWTIMATPVDTGWHTLSVYRTSPNTAGFQIDDNPVETTTTNVSTNNLPVFLMSFGAGNQFEVDWVRVRSWCGAEATGTLQAEQFHNDPPVAEDDSYITQHGQTLNVPAPGPLGNDSDPNGDPVSWDLMSGPDNGTVTMFPDGSFSYIPDPGFSGADSFIYILVDSFEAYDLATVSITVSAAEPTCIDIQRGVSGSVEDSYIWAAMPTLDSTTAGAISTGIRVHIRNGPGETRSLLRFDLADVPEGASITSATLGMTGFGTYPSQTIGLFRITAPWSEATGTNWTAQADAYDSTQWSSMLAQTGPISADLTDLVSAWVNGTYPNYGMMLINIDDQTVNSYRASDFSTISVRPSLQVCYLASLGPAVSIEITPAVETLPAGASIAYQATAMDAGGHTWDVTSSTSFSIQPGAGGSWSGNTYTSQNIGSWTVTGTYDGLTDTAELNVQLHGSATSIELAPSLATIVAGESQAYQVTAQDAYGNTWDVTAESTFSIQAGSGGSWSGDTYTSQTAGTWTVSAAYSGLTDTASLTVEHAPAAALSLDPATATIPAGGDVTYLATAADAFGNTWDATADTVFSTPPEAGGAWSANTYTSQNTGSWTVTGAYAGLTSTAALEVVPGGEPTCTTIQRGTSGAVEDSYIWSVMPTLNSATSGILSTGTRVNLRLGPGETRTLLHFSLDDIPQQAVVTSATLGMTVFGTDPSQTISLYRITAPWSEATGTNWTAQADAYDSTAWGSLTAVTGPVSADLTGLVSAWINGTFPNYGLMLINTDDQSPNSYRSSEFYLTTVRPSLQVCYLTLP